MRLFILFILLIPTLTLAAEPMKFVYYDDYRPRSWSENGKMHGMIVDIIDEAFAKRLKIPVTHTGYPWKRAQYMVEIGKADAFITMPNKKRKEYTFISNEPVLTFSLKIITRNNHPKLEEMKKITSIKQLKNYKIADYLGNGWAERNLKGMDVEWLGEGSIIPKFLIAKRADLTVASKRTIFEIKYSGYESQITILPNELSSVSFHLCVGKQSPYKDIINDFDRIIKEMKDDGTLKNIEESYYK